MLVCLFTENANLQSDDKSNAENATANSDASNDEDDNDSDESDDGKLFNTVLCHSCCRFMLPLVK